MEAHYTVNKQERIRQLGTQNFAWGAMQAQYGNGDSEASRQAVANLMVEVGAAVGMAYTPQVSGAPEGAALAALQEIFGYSEDMRLVYRSEQSAQEWVKTIHRELSANRPVFMTGCSETIGHAFVCDGMDAQGRGHINWGWDGMSDGYFRLDDLDPRKHGIGGSDGGSGYSMEVSIITGVAPRKNSEPIKPFIPRFSYRRCLVDAVQVPRGRMSYPVLINRLHMEALGVVSGHLFVAIEGKDGKILSRNPEGKDYSFNLDISGTAATMQGFSTVGIIPEHFPTKGEYKLRFVVRLHDGPEIVVRRASREGDYTVRCTDEYVEFVPPAERYYPRLTGLSRGERKLYAGMVQTLELDICNEGEGQFDGHIKCYLSEEAKPSMDGQLAKEQGLAVDEGASRTLRVPVINSLRAGRTHYAHLYC